MAELFRVLMRDNRGLAPLEDEISLCRQYLALEKVRLGDRLQIDWQLTGMPSDALVPPLMLQPLLENAIYHGIEPLSTPGIVTIRIFRKDTEVHAILSNPFRPDAGLHRAGNKMALANLRERLALHFDAEASLQARMTDNVYEARIRIPYRKAKRGVPNAYGPDTEEIFGPMGSASAAPASGNAARSPAKPNPTATVKPKESHG
jgi:two-component system sensor histidine kinase AlgZ